MSNTKRPLHEIRLASIHATIWGNTAQSGRIWYRVSITRVYLDQNEWKSTSSFGRDDLPLVSKAAELAYAWIWRQTNNPTNGKPAHAD